MVAVAVAVAVNLLLLCILLVLCRYPLCRYVVTPVFLPIVVKDVCVCVYVCRAA